MGGLIARWYIEKCGGAEIARKLITLGTPYRGAARALDQLVNGANGGLGPFRLDLTGFGRSMPSLHQLMPEYACLQQGGDLAKTTNVTLPELDPAMVTDAMRFHTDLQRAEAERPQSLAATHAIVGTIQTTATEARLTGGRIELVDTYRDEDLAGDSTVPIVAACRADVPMDSNTLRRVPDKHGNLQRNTAALDEIEGILTASSIEVRAATPVALRVEVPEFALADEPITVTVIPAARTRQAIHLNVMSETGSLVETRRLPQSGGTVTIDGLAPGAYTIDAGTDLVSPFAPVSSDVLVWASLLRGGEAAGGVLAVPGGDVLGGVDVVAQGRDRVVVVEAPQVQFLVADPAAGRRTRALRRCRAAGPPRRARPAAGRAWPRRRSRVPSARPGSDVVLEVVGVLRGVRGTPDRADQRGVEDDRELVRRQAELPAERGGHGAGPQPLLERHPGGEVGSHRHGRQYLGHPDPRHAGEYKHVGAACRLVATAAIRRAGRTGRDHRRSVS